METCHSAGAWPGGPLSAAWALKLWTLAAAGWLQTLLASSVVAVIPTRVIVQPTQLD